MRILSLDSDGSYQRDLAAELQASGHQVDLLDSAVEALACDAVRPFDLVIVEARVADGDAVSFLRDLRAARGGGAPAAIVLTDDEEPGFRERCLEAGAMRFLRKSDGWPLTTSEIYGVMTELEPLVAVAAPPAAPGPDARVFRGNLDGIDIVDIVQLLNLGRKTGTLVLSAGPREGRMHFEDGEVVAATSGGAPGPAAFGELLLLKRGTFRFEAGPLDVDRNVHQPTSTLLLDALRLHDEESRPVYDRPSLAESLDPFGAAQDFDLPHVSRPQEEHAEQRPDGWRYAGVSPDEVLTGQPAPEAALAPERQDPAAEESDPHVPFPPAPARADLDISRSRLPASRRRRRLRLPVRASRNVALAGIASVVLFGSGSVVLFSDVLGDSAEEREQRNAYRELILEAAENQQRIDSLEQVIHQMVPAEDAGAPSPEAARQISLIQGQIAKIEADRDAIREAAARSQPEAERRDRERREREQAERAERERQERLAARAEAAEESPSPAASTAPGAEAGPERDTAGSPQPEPQRLTAVDAVPLTAPVPQPRDGAPAPATAPVPTAGAELDYSLGAIRRAPQFVPVDARPTPRSPIRPAYPAALAERKIGGTVTLWVLVDAGGGVQDVRVLRTSGYSELDRAAAIAIRLAAYNPARRSGASVPAWTQQQVLFKLD